jgi:hypothetical protein
MRIKIESLGASIIINAPDSVCYAITQNYFLKEYTPAVSAVVSENSETSNINITLGNSFCISGQNIITTLLDSDIRSIIVIAGALLERLRQEQRLYQVHGSAVKINDKAIVLIGGMSGIGKTTLALNLSCLSGATFFSDEKFVIDGENRTIVGGCPLSHDNRKIEYENTDNIIYDNVPTRLGLVIFPIITNETELTAYKLDELKLFWHFYEEATRDIRGLNLLFNNFNETINGFDTEPIMQQRVNDFKNISQSTLGYFLRGNLKNISDFIYNFIKSST